MSRLLFVCILLTLVNPVLSQKYTSTSSVFDALVLSLDENGQKWEVTPGIRKNILRSMDVMRKPTPTTKSAAKKRSKKLLALLYKALDHCNMPNNGHDEFHKWALTYEDVLIDIKQALFFEDQQLYFKEVHRALDVYRSYFD